MLPPFSSHPGLTPQHTPAAPTVMTVIQIPATLGALALSHTRALLAEETLTVGVRIGPLDQRKTSRHRFAEKFSHEFGEDSHGAVDRAFNDWLDNHSERHISFNLRGLKLMCSIDQKAI